MVRVGLVDRGLEQVVEGHGVELRADEQETPVYRVPELIKIIVLVEGPREPLLGEMGGHVCEVIQPSATTDLCRVLENVP